VQLLVQIRSTLDLATRRQRQISNEMNRTPAIYGELLAVRDHMRDWKEAIHRDEVGPCRTFNCHGLTFASRRTWIDASSEIQKILDDDDYVEVAKAKVKAGDIAIFRTGGQIDHSGIVVEITPIKGPRILSKWAFLHEVIHYPFEGPYNDCQVSYYRVVQ
jgi:hypothetical protein